MTDWKKHSNGIHKINTIIIIMHNVIWPTFLALQCWKELSYDSPSVCVCRDYLSQPMWRGMLHRHVMYRKWCLSFHTVIQPMCSYVHYFHSGLFCINSVDCWYEHHQYKEQDHLQKNTHSLSMISVFHCEVGENCALLGYHVVISGNFLTLTGGIDRLYRNVRKKLPPLTAK